MKKQHSTNNRDVALAGTMMLPKCGLEPLLRLNYGGKRGVYTTKMRGTDMRMIFRKAGMAFVLAWLAVFATAASAPKAEASSAAEIDMAAQATLREFFYEVPGSRELVRRAAAVLVFPTVIKAGIGVGGEYGEGALIRRGRTVEYYNTVSASFGFQLGAQARSVIIVFMTPEALHSFQRVDGWKVGVDGSIALITIGAGASVDTTRIVDPIIGFIFDGKGLMYNLTLEGSKISRIHPY
jgi:lipid-binding SYLF domain-containing protein